MWRQGVVACVVTLALAASAAGEVERLAPADAMVAVRARNVDSAVGSLAKLLGMPPTLLYMGLGQAVANTPLGPMAQGFKADGELMLVVLRPRADANPAVLVVPVTNYQQYLGGMTNAPGSKHIKDASGLDVIEFRTAELDAEATAAARERGDWEPKYKFVTERRFLAEAGAWAIVAADGKACQAVLAQRKPDAKSLFTLAAPNQLTGMGQRSILAVVGVQNVLAAFADEIEALKKGQFPGMPGMSGPGMPVPGMPVPAPVPAPGTGPVPGPTPMPMPPGGMEAAEAMKQVGKQLGQLLTVIEQLDLLAVGLDAGEAGLTITGWATPRKGSKLAEIALGRPAGTPALVRFLPTETAIGGAVTLDPKALPPVVEVLMGMMPGREEMPKEERDRMDALMRKQIAAMGHSMVFALREPPAGGPLLYVDEIMAVTDAAAAREATREGLQLAPMSPAQTQGVKVTTKREENVRTYKGHQVDRVTITFDTTAAPAQVKQSLQAMYGDALVMEVSLGEKQMLVAAGGANPLNRVIDTVEGGAGGLSGTANYRLAMSGLPVKRDGEFYVSIRRLLVFVKAVMDRMSQAAAAEVPGMPGGMPEMPSLGTMLLGPVLDKMQGDLPVGLGLVAGEKRVDVFVPTATIKALGAVVAGAGPGQPPMPPMPPMP